MDREPTSQPTPALVAQPLTAGALLFFDAVCALCTDLRAPDLVQLV